MATCDLREGSGVKDRARFTKALDELQRTLKVIPQEVLYEPWFTYIWTLSEGRFAAELASKMRREDALREVARAFVSRDGDDVTPADHDRLRPRTGWIHGDRPGIEQDQVGGRGAGRDSVSDHRRVTRA